MSIDISKYKKTSKVVDAPKSNKESTSILDFLNKDISLFGTQLNQKKKEAFYSELEILLKAGLDLKTSLELVEESQKKEKEKLLYMNIRDDIISGKSFHQALEATKKFSTYEIFSIKIAEESGKLTPILAELAQYFNRNIQYQRMFISAMSYPSLVIFVAMLTLVFLLNFLVPLFADIYARLDQTLPSITVGIIYASDLVRAYLKYVLLGIVVTGAVVYWNRKKNLVRKMTAAILTRIPIFGVLIKRIYLARFCQAMSFLLGSKVPMLFALDLIKKMISFYPIEVSLDKIKQDITEGQPFNESLKQFSIYPNRMVSLVRVGEEANQLENMFSKLASQYNDDVEQRTKMLGSLIEPVLIVFLALIVGVVLVSMYLPIFKLVTDFG